MSYTCYFHQPLSTLPFLCHQLREKRNIPLLHPQNVIPPWPRIHKTRYAEPGRLPVLARAVGRADCVFDHLLPRACGGQFGFGGQAADYGHPGDERAGRAVEGSVEWEGDACGGVERGEWAEGAEEGGHGLVVWGCGEGGVGWLVS